MAPYFPVRHRWVSDVLSTALHNFQENPATQIRIHKFFIRFWVLNFLCATVVFFVLPGVWSQFSVYYLVAVSLYANFATDYDALSASQASLHGIESRDTAADAVIRVHGMESDVELLKMQATLTQLHADNTKFAEQHRIMLAELREIIDSTHKEG